MDGRPERYFSFSKKKTLEYFFLSFKFRWGKIFGRESLRADERVLNAVCTALITRYHISHNQLMYSFFSYKQKALCLWLILVKNGMNVNYLMIYIEAVSPARIQVINSRVKYWIKKLTKEINFNQEWIILKIMELCGFNIKLIMKWNWQDFDVYVLISANHKNNKKNTSEDKLW